MLGGLVQRLLRPLSPNGYLWSRPLFPGLVARMPDCVASLVPSRHFKVRTSARLRCEHCYFARRGGTLYVRCKMHGRHKQRQGRATRKQNIF